ncbi:MAG TPA: proline hydroxylase, partial [Phenylobacterium sp.]|nr:proline hydroxylase [Phenylobacterium sp.]
MERDLDTHGATTIPGLLSPKDCATVAGWYDTDLLFRSRVVMSRHGFGRGEY